MNIGEATKKARKKAGLKRRELAEKSGYTYANIRNIENNLVNPKIDTVIDLAETLGISIYEYIGIKPKEEVVEKQIPKKTTEREYVPNGTLVYGCCPNCSYFTKNHFKYCAKCGQALDWSDTE